MKTNIHKHWRYMVSVGSWAFFFSWVFNKFLNFLNHNDLTFLNALGFLTLFYGFAFSLGFFIFTSANKYLNKKDDDKWKD